MLAELWEPAKPPSEEEVRIAALERELASLRAAHVIGNEVGAQAGTGLTRFVRRT